MDLTKQQALEIADKWLRDYHYVSFESGKDANSSYEYELHLKALPTYERHDVRYYDVYFKFSTERSVIIWPNDRQSIFDPNGSKEQDITNFVNNYLQEHSTNANAGV